MKKTIWKNITIGRDNWKSYLELLGLDKVLRFVFSKWKFSDTIADILDEDYAQKALKQWTQEITDDNWNTLSVEIDDKIIKLRWKIDNEDVEVIIWLNSMTQNIINELSTLLN